MVVGEVAAKFGHGGLIKVYRGLGCGRVFCGVCAVVWVVVTA
jgi:hypothetical protein